MDVDCHYKSVLRGVIHERMADNALIDKHRMQRRLLICRSRIHLFGITKLRKIFQLPSGCFCQTVRYRSMMLFPFWK